MGKIKQGILGNVSGKVGNVIGGSWKGIGTVRIVPSSVSNPQTAGQVEQRSRMSGAVLFAQSLLSGWIKPLFDRFATKQSGFNAWISANISLFVAGVLVNPAALIMSIGNMAATAIATAILDVSTGLFTVTWSAAGSGFQLATDVAFTVVYNATKGWVVTSADGSRADATLNYFLTEEIDITDEVHCWLVFRRVNGIYVSLASTSLVTLVP
jgi:hypothetical protein